MAGRMLVKLLFLMMFYELLLFSASEAWWHCDSKNPPGTWENTWQESFTFTCPGLHGALVEWQSVHRNCKEDRVHRFRCAHSPLPYGSKCAWIFYVNDYDQKVDFTCPNDGLLTGVKSEYSKVHHDRKFHFQCCQAYGKYTLTCGKTGWQNNWDGDLSYTAPANYYLAGAYSVHDNFKEDRRWEFLTCRFNHYNHHKK